MLLLQSYENTYYAEKSLSIGKDVYIGRNREIIDKSYICVIYNNK